MPYTNPDTMMEVANILEDFDEESLKDIFKSQILSEDNYTSLPINHFHPLYLSFERAIKIANTDEDDIDLIKSRYYNICLAIIKFINDKYNLEIDNGWVNAEFNRLPSLAMALYQFFILDIFYIILESLNNYIYKNIDDLFNVFADAVQNKDVSTTTNMKTMNPKYAVIASCMFDVTDYVFSMIDSETIFDYIDANYRPGAILNKMIENGIITGDFVHTIADIYKDNLALRSKIAFELIYRIKKLGYLPVNSITIHSSQLIKNDVEEAPTASSDIEDDVAE